MFWHILLWKSSHSSVHRTSVSLNFPPCWNWQQIQYSDNNIQWSYQSCDEVLMAHSTLNSNMPQWATVSVPYKANTHCHPPMQSHLCYSTRSFSLQMCIALEAHLLLKIPWVQFISHMKLAPSLVPRPRPAFRHLQYGKAGEVLVSFLTWAWCNWKMAELCKTNRLRFMYFRLTTRSTLGVWDSCLPLASYVW